MSRRGPYITAVHCTYPGCNETAHYSYDTLADQRDGHRRRAKTPHLCTRHTKPGQVLTPNNLTREVVLVATPGDGPYIKDKLFWKGEGELTSGFTFGPGFKAYADDFPAGTRLVVSARIEFPEETG